MPPEYERQPTQEETASFIAILDRDELPNPERFRQFDRNSDGAMTLDEARAALRGSGP